MKTRGGVGESLFQGEREEDETELFCDFDFLHFFFERQKQALKCKVLGIFAFKKKEKGRRTGHFWKEK